jgi:transposase-like protein
MFPLAFGFFQSETIESWTWFMTQLKKVVGDLAVLAICSDAQKGLMHAISECFLNAEKKECFRHLMGNYVKIHTGSEHMYPAARAYRREVFEHHVSQVRSVTKIAKYLDQHHKFIWSRSGFDPSIKCDYITNNMAEVFNDWIKDHKDLPVCDIADKVREMTMELFHRRRICERLQGVILPSVMSTLKAQTRVDNCQK